MQASEIADEGTVHIVADEVIGAFRIGSPEGVEVPWIELPFGPFALDGDRNLISPRQNKVDFVLLFVPPIPDVAGLKVALQFIQHEVFPEDAEIIWAGLERR